MRAFLGQVSWQAQLTAQLHNEAEAQVKVKVCAVIVACQALAFELMCSLAAQIKHFQLN